MSDTQHLTESAWRDDILAARPGVTEFIPTCRLESEPPGITQSKDAIFRRHLRTSETIPYSTGFYPAINIAGLDRDQQGLLATRLLIPSSTLVFELRQGVSGFNGTAHGGLISALMDEAMGSLIYINDRVYRQMLGKGVMLPNFIVNMDGLLMFTASMNVRFRKPLPLPKTVFVQATSSKIEGRKFFLDVTVADDRGTVFADCVGMWMSVPKGSL